MVDWAMMAMCCGYPWNRNQLSEEEGGIDKGPAAEQISQVRRLRGPVTYCQIYPLLAAFFRGWPGYQGG